MKIVKVTYSTVPDYADHNKRNIGIVMAAMQRINDPAIRYEVFLAPDGVSFTHLAIFQTPEAEPVLLMLPEFQLFQQELKANGLTEPPHQEILEMVGNSIPR